MAKLNADQLARLQAEIDTHIHPSASEKRLRQLLNHIKTMDEEVRVLWVGINTGNIAFDSVMAQNRALKQQLKIALRNSGWEPPSGE